MSRMFFYASLSASFDTPSIMVDSDKIIFSFDTIFLSPKMTIKGIRALRLHLTEGEKASLSPKENLTLKCKVTFNTLNAIFACQKLLNISKPQVLFLFF